MKEIYKLYSRYKGDDGKLSNSITLRYILTSSAYDVCSWIRNGPVNNVR